MLQILAYRPRRGRLHPHLEVQIRTLNLLLCGYQASGIIEDQESLTGLRAEMRFNWADRPTLAFI